MLSKPDLFLPFYWLVTACFVYLCPSKCLLCKLAMMLLPEPAAVLFLTAVSQQHRDMQHQQPDIFNKSGVKTFLCLHCFFTVMSVCTVLVSVVRHVFNTSRLDTLDPCSLHFDFSKEIQKILNHPCVPTKRRKQTFLWIVEGLLFGCLRATHVTV